MRRYFLTHLVAIEEVNIVEREKTHNTLFLLNELGQAIFQTQGVTESRADR